MQEIFNQTAKSVGIAIIVELILNWLKAPFLHNFFNANLITIVVALLAINTTTLGIVLSKLRDLMDQVGGGDFFTKTKRSMLMSIHEQISLIVIATALLSTQGAAVIQEIDNLPFIFNVSITATFVYALLTLYDTARCIFIILDYDPNQNE